jgi:adenine-specific DNA methylase
MMKYPKRLIEVDLPIKRISAHARREKSIRHGHICTLHIWWARRPLAACRAVICASLWPDPADELCPGEFRKTARELMTKWAKDHLKLMSDESSRRFIAISKDDSKLNDNVALRKALLDFIADFANWDNSTVKEYLETAKWLTQAAHEALGGEPGSRPLVVDPFAGGGSIPLEALRVGADAFASDLNPVAVLLNKVVLEYIPKYGQKLADEVRKWGQWVREHAEKELAIFYPKDPDESTPISYIWARTILSEAPGQGDVPVEVPLISSMWLANKKNRKYALRWVRDKNEQVKTEIVEVAYADGVIRKVCRPILEIFEPKNDSEVETGTVVRGSAICPVSGFTTHVTRIRVQLKARTGGTDDARLISVVTTHSGTNGRFYRLSRHTDLQAVQAVTEELRRRIRNHTEELSIVPTESNNKYKMFNNSTPIYGMESWGALFTKRQALFY